MNKYIDHLEIQWYQLRGEKHIEPPFHLNVIHVEEYIWSYDRVIRHQDILDGIYQSMSPNWVNQLTMDSTSSIWVSPVIDVDDGWKPLSIRLDYDDREDYSYVNTLIEYRGSNTKPLVNINGNQWKSGDHPHTTDPFSTIPWSIYHDCTSIEDDIKYIQVSVEFNTSDPLLRFPVFKACYLSKEWNLQGTWTIPKESLQYDDGQHEDTSQTSFRGLTLSPAIDSTSPNDGLWVSPIHDFGISRYPRWARWYGLTPFGTFIDSTDYNGGAIQVRGSNIEPQGSWTQDKLPDPGDPVWGTNGSLKDSWYDIVQGQMITDIIGTVRYCQFRIRMGIYT